MSEWSREDYRKAAGEYADYLLQARKRFERAEVEVVQQVREVYTRAAEQVRDEIRTVTPGTLRERHLLSILQSLNDLAQAIQEQTEETIIAGIQLAVELALRPAEQIAMDLFGDTFDRSQVRAMYDSVNQRAVVALVNRTLPDGLRLSDRVWRTGRKWNQAVQRVIEDMVARGMDSRKAARELEKYLKPGVYTTLKAETRRRLGVPKDVSMEAMRLAVTEMNNAFQEGTIMANRATPSYRGIYWRLSHNHPIRDICDDYANHNGNGFWPEGEEPTRPHPWCRCHVIPAHEDTDAFAQRLREWLNDPQSHPDIEKWYQEQAKPFLQSRR